MGLLGLCCIALLGVAGTVVWVQHLGEPHERITGSTLSLDLRWTYRVADSLSDPPWYYHGAVLVRSNRPAARSGWRPSFWTPNDSDSGLTALDAATGKRKWAVERHLIGTRRDAGLGLDAGGRVVVITHSEGAVVAVDRDSGSVQWRRGQDAIRAIVADEQTLYTTSGGEVRAYDLASGRWLWTKALNANSGGMPALALDQGRVFLLGRQVWALDLGSGEFNLIVDMPCATQALLLTHGRILAMRQCESPASLVAYDAHTGQQIWSRPYGFDNPLWLPTVAGDRLLFRVDTGSLLAVDINSGNLLWEYHPANSAQVVSNAAVLGRLVYVLASDNTLRGVDLESGREVGALHSAYMKLWYDHELLEPVSVAGVAASDDMLYVSFGGRTLYAFQPAN